MPPSSEDLNAAAGVIHSLQSYSSELTMGTLSELRFQAAVTRTVKGLVSASAGPYPAELMLMTHTLLHPVVALGFTESSICWENIHTSTLVVGQGTEACLVLSEATGLAGTSPPRCQTMCAQFSDSTSQNFSGHLAAFAWIELRRSLNEEWLALCLF